jgi:hypothetical protein
MLILKKTREPQFEPILASSHDPTKVPKFHERALWYSIDWKFHSDGKKNQRMLVEPSALPGLTLCFANKSYYTTLNFHRECHYHVFIWPVYKKEHDFFLPFGSVNQQKKKCICKILFVTVLIIMVLTDTISITNFSFTAKNIGIHSFNHKFNSLDKSSC